MNRITQLLLTVAAAAAVAGCEYPETKMEPVGSTQIQTQQQPAPPAAPAGEQQAKKDKKTAG
jgi:hypothetical protein